MAEARFTYSDLIDYSAEQMQLPRPEVHRRLKLLMDIVQQGLIRDQQVSVPGLGVFKLKWQAERNGRNPRTGEPMIVPGHQRVLFKPEAGLRKFINRKYESLSYTATPEPSESIPSTQPVVIPSTSATMWDTPKKDEEEVRYIPPQRRFKLRWLIGLLVLILLVWLLISLCKKGNETVPTPKSETTELTHPKSVPDAESKQDENKHETPPAKQIVFTFPESSYTVRAGDRLWDISDAHYHSAYYWPVIYQANRSQLPRPDALVPGLPISLPALECPDSKLSESDKIKLAEGYLSVYKIYSQNGQSDAYHYLWAANALNPDLDLSQIDPNDLRKIRRMKGRLRL